MTAIAIEGVTKTYGRRRGISDLDLAVEEGEVFGYLGPNGAGKTTTIRMILDLIRPSIGRVSVFGGSPENPAIRAAIGYLPGELDLYGRLTGEELCRFFDRLRGGGHIGRAHATAERLGLPLDRPVKTLSKGNKQKLGLVQAFMHQPRLLVLDEPTSGLDPLVQHEFFVMLAEARAAGATIFLSSHVLAEVERIAGRIGIIREGRLVEVATFDQLRAQAVRSFEVTFEGAVPDAQLAGLEGVTNFRRTGQTILCDVTGSIDPFVKALAAFNVVGLVSHGADLERVFMAYYRGGEDG